MREKTLSSAKWIRIVAKAAFADTPAALHIERKREGERNESEDGMDMRRVSKSSRVMTKEELKGIFW